MFVTITTTARDGLENAQLVLLSFCRAWMMVSQLFKLRNCILQFLHSTNVELASACIAGFLQALDVVFQDLLVH